MSRTASASVPLRPKVHLPVSLIWRAERRRPPAAQAFLEYALEQLGAPTGATQTGRPMDGPFEKRLTAGG